MGNTEQGDTFGDILKPRLNMRRQYKKSAFLIKFTDGSYDLAKALPTIASSSTQMVPVILDDGKGNEEMGQRPQTSEHHSDYINYVDQGDSGSVAVNSNVIWWKAVKFFRDDDIVRTFTLDGKPFINFSFK